MSLVDIVNLDGKPTGQTATQKECFEKGLLKRCAWIFFVCQKRGILFQMRSKNKSLYPSHWHVTVSGHLDVWETPTEWALREVREELGLKLEVADLHFQGVFAEKKTLPNGFITNDLLYVYLVNWTDRDSNFTLQEEEVDALQWFSFEELEQKFSGEWPENFVPYRRIFQSMVSLAQKFLRK